MSSRRKRDYNASLRSLLTLLPHPSAVQEFVTDFESAAWRADATALQEVKLQGCAFHWGQAVWRKAKSRAAKALFEG